MYKNKEKDYRKCCESIKKCGLSLFIRISSAYWYNNKKKEWRLFQGKRKSPSF